MFGNYNPGITEYNVIYINRKLPHLILIKNQRRKRLKNGNSFRSMLMCFINVLFSICYY